jgi:hypothetical protein
LFPFTIISSTPSSFTGTGDEVEIRVYNSIQKATIEINQFTNNTLNGNYYLDNIQNIEDDINQKLV